ncbi:MAG: hypothetical protein K0R08_1602 [Solimicrobium sp.]|jgi:hypothetical protein|nr:hypothetical protein [Solimicrobium sp.]
MAIDAGINDEANAIQNPAVHENNAQNAHADVGLGNFVAR